MKNLKITRKMAESIVTNCSIAYHENYILDAYDYRTIKAIFRLYPDLIPEYQDEKFYSELERRDVQGRLKTASPRPKNP